jgi:hypothetical protein
MTIIAALLGAALVAALAWGFHQHRVHEEDEASIRRLYDELDQARAALEEWREGAIEHEADEGPGDNGASNGSATSLH